MYSVLSNAFICVTMWRISCSVSWSTEAFCQPVWPPRAAITESRGGGICCATTVSFVTNRHYLSRSLLSPIISVYCLLIYRPYSFHNFEALVDISLSSLSRDTWPVTDQSNRLSNMSLFTLGSRQRSGGWHSRKLGANTRSYEREHVAFNYAHVINYHRWVVISRDKRDSLIVARLLPPRSLESARACVRAFVRTYVRTYVWIYECVCVSVCCTCACARACGIQVQPWRDTMENWRPNGLQRPDDGRPVNHSPWSERREIRHPFNPSSYLTPLLVSPSPTMNGTVLRFCPYHLVVERAPSYTLPREIAQHFWKYYSCYRKRTFRRCPSFCGKKHSSQIRETYWRKKNVLFIDYMFGLWC